MTLTCYSNVFTDLTTLYGILPKERVEEAIKYSDLNSFEIPKLENGKTINNYYIHIPSGLMWHKDMVDRAKTGSFDAEYLKRQILETFFTNNEKRLINDKVSQEWRVARERDRVQKAKPIKFQDYKGWVYIEGVGYDDGYFESVDELLDFIESSDDDVLDIHYCWPCEAKRFGKLCADSILEGALEESFDGFGGFEGEKELREAIKQFNDKNTDCLSYYPRYDEVIILN